MRNTQVGVISSVRFGFGGYQEAMLGLTLNFDFKGSGVSTFESAGWLDHSPNAKWSLSDRAELRNELCDKLVKVMRQAKVDDVSKLKGKPVECEFEGNMLKTWRILEEAIL